MNKICFTLFALAFLALSCDNRAIIDQYVVVPDQSWDHKSNVEIPVQINDQNQKYDIYFNFRHAGTYPYSNLFIQFHMREPGELDAEITERFELKLAEPDGKWTGKGVGGKYSHQQLLFEGYQFRDTGLYHVSLEQHMREDKLLGVNAVGIRIVKSQPKT